MPTRTRLEFTQREVNIAYMLGRGYRIQDIARRYKVTTGYMNLCVQALYRKTGTKNKTHLVYWMLDQCYLEYPLNKNRKKPKRPTPKQLEAIELFARGYTIPTVARRLGISDDSAIHRAIRAARNLGAQNTTHLVAICWEEDWFV